MFRFLKRRAAMSSADWESSGLLSALSERTVFVLSLNPSGEYRGDPADTDAVLAWMDQNARETSAPRSLDIYCYEEGGRRVRPFFSAAAHVGTFINSDPAHKWKAFTGAGLTGAKLFSALCQAASLGTQIILNPRSPEERLIAADALPRG